MPIYEYSCKTCGNEFEELIVGDAKPGCPSCGSHDWTRTSAPRPPTPTPARKIPPAPPNRPAAPSTAAARTAAWAILCKKSHSEPVERAGHVQDGNLHAREEPVELFLFFRAGTGAHRDRGFEAADRRMGIPCRAGDRRFAGHRQRGPRAVRMAGHAEAFQIEFVFKRRRFAVEFFQLIDGEAHVARADSRCSGSL